MNKDVRDSRWYLRPEPHTHVFDNVKTISRRTSVRRQMDLYHACLYDDSEMTGLGPTTYMASEYEPSRLAFNVVRQTVYTLAAKIAKNQPLPTPITSGGTYAQKKRAKKFGKVIEGQFDATGVWRMSPTIARDCGLFGTGVAHNYRVGKTLHHERVFPWELAIDPREAMYGKPRTIYLRRWVDRYVMMERFPEHADAILNCADTDTDTYDLGYDDTADLVLVVEAWHLPSRTLDADDTDDHDGVHTICVNNATLVREEWRRNYFPFSTLRMSDPVVGWFGTGLAKQLTGLQYTINDTAAVVQEAFALSGGYIAIEKGSGFNVDKLVNGAGNIFEFTGAPPQWINPQPIHPDHMNFVNVLIPKAFEMTGVSQLSSQSQKPAGIESALALNTFNDIETERFALFAKQYEEYHIDVAWQFFDLLEEIHEEYGDYTVRATAKTRGHRLLEKLEYKKVRMDKEEFVLQVFPTSLLSKKPSARIQEVENLANAGWIGPDDAKMLLDFPDLERMNDLGQASRRIVEDAVCRMLEAEDVDAEGVYTYPEAAFDLNLCVKLGLVLYLEAKLDGCPEENLNLVLQFVADSRTLLAKANGQGPQAPTGDAPMQDPNMGQPAPAPPPGMPGMPPDMGMPPGMPAMPPPDAGQPAPLPAPPGAPV